MANKKTQEIFYAVVGAGEFAMDKVRNLPKYADKKTTQKYYKDFVKRGKNLTTTIRNSGPTKRALAQTKTARSQVKAARTSVTKAAGANAKATKSAATKTAQAS